VGDHTVRTNAIKLNLVGVQSFSFGRDWSRWDGVAKTEDSDSNAVRFLNLMALTVRTASPGFSPQFSEDRQLKSKVATNYIHLNSCRHSWL